MVKTQDLTILVRPDVVSVCNLLPFWRRCFEEAFFSQGSATLVVVSLLLVL
jgi:hypothetical protein